MNDIVTKSPGIYGSSKNNNSISGDFKGGVRGGNGIISYSTSRTVDHTTGETTAASEVGLSIGPARGSLGSGLIEFHSQ